jgi:lactoylglutathione lyase
MGKTTKIADVRTIGVPVTDQERALDFYVGTLGFEKRLDAPIPGGGRWIEVGPTGSTTTVALITARDGLPAGVETGIRFVTANAEADHAYLREGGVDTEELLRWPGVPPMFKFRDPDGNGLEIVGQA